jgi:hypothetical protein
MSKDQKTDADQQQFWQMALETFKSSGLSVRQFCKQEGLTEPAFYTWRKKLDGGGNDEKNQDKPKLSEPEFIEVAIPQNNSAAVELLLASGNTLRIPGGVDAATLNTVLSAVHMAGLC